VVHTFKPKAYAGLAHVYLRRRFPVVVDTDDWEGPGGWNDLQPYSGLLKRFFTWQERDGLAHARAVTAASRALQTLTWAVGGPAERVFYLPNGVEIAESRVVDTAAFKRPTVLLYTRFYEANLDRLWRILAAVRAKMPEASILTVGKGFFGEENELMARARGAGWKVAETTDLTVEADLIYTGYGTSDRLPAYFARADVGLYLFDDTLVNRTKCPVKLLDLLAAGVPVVGEAVGEIAHIVQHGQTGLLAPPAAEPALVESLLKLLGDPEQRSAMAAACIPDIRERFSWAALAETAESAYTYALRQPKTR
jgi:glycosyltransferase involved in cell wall biosynthesis